MIQAYSNDGKAVILTQSLIIQRSSQRLLIIIAPSLIAIPEMQIRLSLRDITQAYTQSTTSLQRLIVARLPKEIQYNYPTNAVIIILKPLYRVPEAGTHWFSTYHRYHIEKLKMATSTYDLCLLITTTKDAFGIVGI